MSYLAQRFVFGTLSLVVVFALLGLDHWRGGHVGMLLLLLFFAIGGWWEYTRLAGCRDRWTRWVGAVAIAYQLLVTTFAFQIIEAMLQPGAPSVPRPEDLNLLQTIQTFNWLVLALVPGLFVLGALRTTPSRDGLYRVAVATLGLLYLSFPAIAGMRIYHEPAGPQWIMLLVLLVKGNDIGAFLVGRKFGKTPLAAVSPNKTREGSAGGLALGWIVALCFATIPEEPLFGLGAATLFAFLVGAVGQVGDLVESYLKRVAGEKDSGSLLPAFGGVLDLLDSVWFALPVFYLLMRVVT